MNGEEKHSVGFVYEKICEWEEILVSKPNPRNVCRLGGKRIKKTPQICKH